MPISDQPQMLELRVSGCANQEQESDLVERIQLTLCPDPDHAPPCPVPWSSHIAENAVIVGIYATSGAADELVRTVAEFALAPFRIDLRPADPADYDEVLVQYETESVRRDAVEGDPPLH